MIIPNFLIIGAQKSGTTSLYYYLKQHPDIFMYPGKEIHFFTYMQEPISDCHISIAEYQSLFSNVKGQRAVGEASPSYIYSKAAPERIKAYNPDMRLIAVLRNPVDRAYSNYLHALRRGQEPLEDFCQALQAEEERITNGWNFMFHYVAKGYYSEQLRRYYQHFDKTLLKIILLEDLRKAPSSTIKGIYQFLQVDENFVPDLDSKHNTAGIAKNKQVGKLLNVLQNSRAINKAVKVLIPYSLREKFKQQIYTQPPMPEEARNYLKNVYQDDINQLQSLIDRDLSSWLER